MSDISVLIKQIRKQCLFSQEEFADMLGVSFATVNRWENEHCAPNYSAIRKIEKLCLERGIEADCSLLVREEIR